MSDLGQSAFNGATGFLRFEEPHAGEEQPARQQARDDEDTKPFARETELRREQEEEPLSGCDVEHCQRMHE